MFCQLWARNWEQDKAEEMVLTEFIRPQTIAIKAMEKAPPLCGRNRTFRRNRLPITTHPMCRTAARCLTKASITCRNRRHWLTLTRACRTDQEQVEAEICAGSTGH